MYILQLYFFCLATVLLNGCTKNKISFVLCSVARRLSFSAKGHSGACGWTGRPQLHSTAWHTRAIRSLVQGWKATRFKRQKVRARHLVFLSFFFLFFFFYRDYCCCCCCRCYISMRELFSFLSSRFHLIQLQ